MRGEEDERRSGGQERRALTKLLARASLCDAIRPGDLPEGCWDDVQSLCRKQAGRHAFAWRFHVSVEPGMPHTS